jgi:hypothetical protein
MTNAFDIFFKKFAYKFPKGYPDMNNEQDILLLESLLEKLGINLNEDKASDRDEAKEILKKELGLSNSDFKDSDLNFFVLVPGNQRLAFVDKIENIKTNTDKEFEFNSTPTSFSSIGYFMYGKSKFGIKPSNKQGDKSAGLDNESTFVNTINSLLIDGPKDIKITGNENSVVYKNITQTKGTGRSTSDYSKSDVNFFDGETDKGGLSLKKDNAIYWESADVRFSKEVKNLVNAIIDGKLGPEISYEPLKDFKGKSDPDIIRMYNKKDNKPIAGIVVKDLPEQDIKQVIFGNDNVPVAIRTWKPSDFEVVGNTIIANATKLYIDLKDVEKDKALPILNIRHDKTRRSTRGLRALLQTEKSLYKEDDALKGSNVTIPYNSFN